METNNLNMQPNSATLNEEDTTLRFKGAEWFNTVRGLDITLAGLGGIGSYVGFYLSRLRPNAINLYDDDIVEAVNMSGQLYSTLDIDSNKAEALARMIRQYSDYYGCNSHENFGEYSDASNIMICGFDNMASRKLYFDSWLERVNKYATDENKSKCLFIDGRLAAEEFQIYCIRGDDEYSINKYKNEALFEDSQAENTVCSYKQTTFCASMIASYMVNLFVNFASNMNADNVRALPFFTSYDCKFMIFKTED